MLKANIKLNTVDKVKAFVKLTESLDAEMDLVSGRYVIDAKSLMGIFSLDLSKPIEFVIHSDDNSLLDKFETFKA